MKLRIAIQTFLLRPACDSGAKATGDAPRACNATAFVGAILFSSLVPTSRVGYGFNYLYGVGLK